MRMKPKMLLGSTALSVIAVALTTIGIVKIASDEATKSLQAEVTSRLVIQRDTQKDNIEGYFKQISSEVSQQATLGGVFTEALVEFNATFPKFLQQVPHNPTGYKANVKAYYDEQFGVNYVNRNTINSLVNSDGLLELVDHNAVALQNFYIAENPNPLGSKQELVNLDISTDYSKIHAKYHPRFTDYLNRHGFYDVFLVDADTGNLIYSVFKELDFATSLKTGPYANSGIGEAFKLALGATEPGQTFTTDMKSYYPSYNDYASFISSPIYIDGKIEGVFMVQMPIDKINQVMTFNNKWSEYGLGESGETYIVANDKTMRNDSRFLKEDSAGFFEALANASIPTTVTDLVLKKDTTVGLMTVDSPGVNAALNGETGFDIFPDYRNIPVLSAYTPLNIAGVNWTLLAEIDETEAFASIDTMINSIIKTALIVGVVVLILGMLASLLFVKGIVSPISHFKDIMDRFTNGEADVRVKLDSDDEIGELARTFDDLLNEREETLSKMQAESDTLNTSVINMLQVAAQLSQGDLTARMEVAEDVTGTLSDSLNLVVDQTSNVINLVKETAQSVEQSANQVKTQSDTVKIASEQELAIVNIAVKDLAESSKQLNNIVLLAKKCNAAADETVIITDSAQQSVSESVEGINSIRDTIRETEKRIKRLGDRSQEIGGVVDLINGIAEKTHVLALNASMQAASAGEAGRGFAVVANEVQRLAESAREATLEISQQVKNIQVDTADTVTAMNKAISQVVEGSQMAEKSGQIMNTTREKSNDLVNLVQEIAIRSEAQAKVAWKLQKQATEIKKSSTQTFDQMSEQTLQTDNLVKYSDQLLQAINTFKIADSDEIQSDNAVNL
ncbi:MAG: methyl-accepting chemotaxis protein [Methylococcales bacterium]